LDGGRATGFFCRFVYGYTGSHIFYNGKKELTSDEYFRLQMAVDTAVAVELF
jgi:uncharacterized membrane protein